MLLSLHFSVPFERAFYSIVKSLTMVEGLHSKVETANFAARVAPVGQRVSVCLSDRGRTGRHCAARFFAIICIFN